MTDDSPRLPSQDDEVPAPIADLCEACVDYVERAIGLTLDFRPETLPLLDHYAAEQRETLQGRPEALPLVAQAVGAYFGEVVRRHLNGFWRIPSPNFHDWQVCGRAAFLAINPIGVGYDAVTGSEDHEGPRSALRVAPEDRAAIEHRLTQLPPVSEDEYFSLSTRLEVLEVATDALQGELQKRGYDEMTYEADDYDAELRPLGV